ncbi:cilia- and flagella-associated protein 45 isoform X2 [Notolabrus celidotus]|uniref:cilia- and flagella-associated protein 45 isoform X2 n=1 Tax=Notolabrus celidotus TaxID=1203425 RepID=UPI00148F738A|nr:cilia- and flagella-associated protein 45 isoform X2 [Notolabrus celidotus]
MTQGSSSKSSRGSFYTRRYRTQAPTSQVDETLFGGPTTLDHRVNSAFKAKNLTQQKQDGEIVQIVTKDLIRHLRVPLKDPSGEFIVLPSAEYERIVSMSEVLTKEEREGLMEAFQRKKEEEIRAAQDRKQQIHEAYLKKDKKGLTELELQTQASAKCLVEQANALRTEQEEEIKKLNTLILGAQCQATRDAQIKERKRIQTELSEEEKRLDNMMEVERHKALETMEQIDELRKHQRMSGMQEIYNQILQRHEERQLLEEMKEQEKQHIQENLKKINLDDQKALEKKREGQQQLQEEIRCINAETMKAKEQRIEEEKLADMRDMEYIRSKLEREAAYEADQRRIMKEKELEISRMRAQQQRAKDYMAEQDEIRIRRNQEATDREWRRKEKELAAKKAQEEAMLKVARFEQVQCKEHFLSVEAAREKAELEQMLEVQQEIIIKQKEEEEKQRQKAKRHAEALRHQVKEREFSAIAKRREIFKEAGCLIEEARQRRERLDEIKEKKLRALKATGLSEKYCSEVERKARTDRL